MKKLILAVAVLAFLAMGTIPVLAETVHNTFGAKFDVPNVIGIPQISNDLHIGFEGGKNLGTDMFFDSLDYSEDDLGYFGYVKVTYDGCWLNCPKGE